MSNNDEHSSEATPACSGRCTPRKLSVGGMSKGAALLGLALGTLVACPPVLQPGDGVPSDDDDSAPMDDDDATAADDDDATGGDQVLYGVPLDDDDSTSAGDDDDSAER